MIKKCGKLPEETAIKILKHILNGFKECYNKNVLHRDLKPDNILIKDKVPKIADFGYGCILNG